MENIVSKFMDVHRNIVGITAGQLRQAHAADLAIQGEEGVDFQHACADRDAGVVYCLSDGPNADAVRRVHERAGHPPDEIHQLPLEV